MLSAVFCIALLGRAVDRSAKALEVGDGVDVDLAAIDADLQRVAAELEPHVVHGEIRTQAVLRLEELAARAGEMRAGDLPDVSGDRPEEIFRYSPVIGPLFKSATISRPQKRSRGHKTVATKTTSSPESKTPSHAFTSAATL